MMYNYPFFGMPRFQRYNYYPNYSLQKNIKKVDRLNEKPTTFNTKPKQEFKSKCEDKDDDEVLFEILGLKLYYDDVLLICLIFFLYQEGVKDDYLFIALILLLLS